MLDIYRGKTVLVTGHTGFKGGWLSEWLMLLGARVVGYALEPPTSPAMFEKLAHASRIDKDFRADIRDLKTFSKVLNDTKPDFLFHMAAQTVVSTGYDNPLENYETNIMGTLNILEALRAADQPCVAIFITTDKVYENKEWLHAYREEDPLGGYDPYSASKACDEIIISSHKRSFFDKTLDLRNCKAVASVRAGNVIGGGDWTYNQLVPDCIRNLKQGQAIPVRNKIATRPWQHVLEPLSGYMTLAEQIRLALDDQDYQRAAQLCSPFNFGPHVTSNRTVKELVEELLRNWPGEWTDASDPNAHHEAGKLNLSSDKAFHLLNWLPRWNFEQAIGKTVDWYKFDEAQQQNSGASEKLIEFTRSQIQAYMQAG